MTNAGLSSLPYVSVINALSLAKDRIGNGMPVVLSAPTVGEREYRMMSDTKDSNGSKIDQLGLWICFVSSTR